MKIFAFPSHTTKEKVSGVDFARIIQPMNHLNKEKDFDIKVYDPKNEKDQKILWESVGKDYDAVYMNYLNSPTNFAAMGCFVRKYNKKLIIDIDDDLWNILPDNPAHKIFHKGSEGLKVITDILNEADYVTVSNIHLRNVVIHNTNKTVDKIKIFPNSIDLKLYKYINKPKEQYNFNIYHFGSTTHFNSLMSPEFLDGMEKIMKEYPHVTFTTVGALLPKFRMKWGLRYANKFGDIDVLKWIKKMPDLLDDADMVVVPLINNVYNRSKSGIKFLEVSSMKLPGCWQNIRQYKELVKDGENGFLCKTKKEWYRSIKKLIEDKDLRKSCGDNAYKDIKDNNTIDKLVPSYSKFFTEILTK